MSALAESLDRMGLDIAEDVVERARTEITRVPSVAQLYEVAREVRAERAAIVREPIAALPPGEVLASMPAEVAEKVRAMHERWDAEVVRDETAETAAWETYKREVKSRPPVRGVCAGVGRRAVAIEGRLCCPACHSPLDEGCRPSQVISA